MEKLNSDLEFGMVNSIVELIKNNQKDIVGAYVVPFSFGEEEKLQVTLVSNSEKEKIENSCVEIEGITLIVNNNSWSIYQQEQDYDDSLYMGNYLQVRDLKNAEIVYDPKGYLTSKKEALKKKAGTLTYFNLSMFFQGVIKLSKERLQVIPEKEDDSIENEGVPKRKKRKRGKTVV